MIVLTSIYKVDMEQFDHVWYCTTTCPGMRVGCEHHPELAGSYEIGKYCIPTHPDYNVDLFYKKYVEELTTSPKLDYLLDAIRRSDAGEWFQFIFYEKEPTDGERPYMYNIIKQYTDNVMLQ